MNRHRDLLPLQKRFNQQLQDLHRQHGYTEDYLAFAESQGIVLTFSPENLAYRHGTTKHVNISFLENENRRSFSAWHEICHQLMQTITTEDGVSIRSDLEECCGFIGQNAKDMEEAWCNTGASLFLFPQPSLESIGHLGFNPLQAIQLAKIRTGSLSAASRRVALLYDHEAFVYLARPDGYIEDAFSVNTKYSIKGGYQIEPNHDMLHPNLNLELDQIQTSIPFKGGRRSMKYTAHIAIDHRNRRLVFFTKSPHCASSNTQTPLLFG
jgi:hypothetical protein